MSHSNSRSKRSPISSYINSLKSSQDLSSTAYFKSKLFRGKSANSISGHLHSLRELNNLKANHNLHTLSYGQLNKFLPANHKSTASQPNILKVGRTSAVPSSLKSSYISLDPQELQEDLPKKKEKHAVPSEQRQILIEKYQAQNEIMHTHKTLSTLDFIWHETLTNGTNHENRSSRPSIAGNKKEFIAISQMLKNKETRDIEKLPNYIRDGSTGRYYVNKSEDETGRSDSEMLLKKSMTSEGPYGLSTKQMETLVNSLKDFHKLLSYTQQSYQKAKAQQTHLGNFVSVFIKEVDQMEKVPKSLNTVRLNMCVSSLQNKIDELTNDKDLIKEQLETIQGLINQKNTNKSVSPTLFHCKRSSLKGYGSSTVSLNCSQNTRPGSSVPYNNASMGPRSSIGEGIDIQKIWESDALVESFRDKVPIDHMQAKTKEIRSEVAKLQKERLLYQEKRRTLKIRVSKTKVTEDSPIRVIRLTTTNTRHLNDSPESEFSYKMESPLARASAPLGLPQLNEPSPRQDEGDFKDNEDELIIEGSGEEGPNRRGRTLDNVEEALKKRAKDNSDCAAKLYEVYSNALAYLEERLKKRLGEMKLFQKDVDEVYTANTKLLTLQVNYCFENLVSEFQNLSRDFESKGKIFMETVSKNYERLLNLTNSNLLKLISVKNIVVSSVKKLKKLEKFCTKYTQLDLTDKSVRKGYDTKYQNIKQKLQGDRKTLQFLTEQFDHSMSMYHLDPMQNPSSQDVSKLVEQSKMLLRVLYNLEKFPVLENDFNEKSTTAYNKCRIGTELVKSLKEFYRVRGTLPAEKYKEGEECMKSLEGLHVKILALQNEMSMLSKLGMFQDTVTKPLLIITKLMKRMDVSLRELKDLLNTVKGDLIVDYTEIIHHSEDVEHQIEGHMKRILQSQEHLNFDIWIQNYTIIQGLREGLIKATEGVARFAEEKYPASIALMPKPQEKMNDLENLEQVVDSLLKTIGTGRIFESWKSKDIFSGITTNTLKERLKDIYDRIQEEIIDKEKILLTIRGSELFKKTVSDVLGVLIQLRFILNRAFELEEQVNHEYHNFQEEHMGKDFYLLNNSFVLEKHKEKYPRFFSQLSMDTSDFLNSPSRGALSPAGGINRSPSSFKRWKSLQRQYTMGLVKMLPTIENTEGEYPNKMTGFIERMKGLFDDFCENIIAPYANEHIVFNEFYNVIKEVSGNEISLLEKGQRAVYNVQVNHIFYNKEIRPLTSVYKYLYVLNSKSDKIEELEVIRENMNLCLKAVASLEEEGVLRGGIEIQMLRYKQIQGMLSNSINMVIDLLSLGTQLNEKEISGHLGQSLRVEEGSLGDFIKNFQKRLQALYDSYELNSDLLEEDTGKLLENLRDFMERVVGILTTVHGRYAQFHKAMSDGLRPHEGSFLGYIGTLYMEIKSLSDEFNENLEEISKLIVRPSWLVKALDNFYKSIVMKDLAILSRLYEETRRLSQFVDRLKEEFFNTEIKQDAKYKEIEISNPTYCDKYVVICEMMYKSLNEFCTIEEIVCRPELKSIITLKVKEMQALKKVLVTFAVVYSMGRKLHNCTNAMLEQTSIIEIYEALANLDTVVGDMVNHLYRELEEAKGLDREYSGLTISINLETVLRDEILVFYTACKRFFGQFKEYLTGIYQFYQELKRKYKNHVLLLRDDWTGFLKEWVSQHFGNLKKKISLLETTDYASYTERMNQFVENLQAQIKVRKHTLLEVMKKVEYLNEYFLNDWFFNSAEEEKDIGDKLYPRVSKLLKNIKQQKYKGTTTIRHKITKLAEFIDRCDKCLRDLSTDNIHKASFEEIRGWNTVLEYYNKQNIGGWKGIIVFALAEIIAFTDEQEEKPRAKEYAKSPEELYTLVEQKLGCELTEIQKEFLEVVFMLP